MKKIPDFDIIMGMNDTSHFIHNINIFQKKNENITLKNYISETSEKRKWSLNNPGFLLGTAYMYFVFGQEKELLKDYDIKEFLPKIKILEIQGKNNKDLHKVDIGDFIKIKLRNAIAHCSYNIEIRSKSNRIENDGQLWFVFEDEYGEGKVKFEMSFPTFGNLVEKAGTHVFNSFAK